jgi:glycerol kinase
MVEVTAIGAAYLAGIQAGIWTKDTVASNRHIDRTFMPAMPANKMEFLYSRWQEAVKRTMGWLTPNETIG